jgi:phenylalanyl-tRNA synthetase beta chain
VTVTGNEEKAEDYIKVSIKDPDLCPRFCARVVKNVKVAPSPKWMQRRLASVGIRPISNLVDITNYVMEEYGQPMHAYDMDTIAGQEIIVRRAHEGETFVTLDGQERTMDDSILMICDGEKAVGIAGIMGGENSMITDEVSTLLFEAANFDGTNIRLSSKKIGLRTDASGKFEKGLDPNNALKAINRACQLIEELGVGEVVGGVVDVYPGEKELSRKIPFEAEAMNRLLGTEIEKETMLSYFEKLELGYDEASNMIMIPSFRSDLECMADLAEEVARFYGYDNIPTTLPTGEATTGRLPFELRVEEAARNVALACGFSQGMCYSFESPKVFDKLLLPEDCDLRTAVTIANPLGEDFSIMRTLPLNGILESLSTNYNHRNKNVRLYELGNIYRKAAREDELPDERMQLTLGMYGEGDFFTLKGVAEELFRTLGMGKKRLYVNGEKKPYLHPGRQAQIRYEGKCLGYLGELHPRVAGTYEIKERVCVAVFDMPEILPFATFDRKYKGVPKYPAVTRDLSMVVPKEIQAGEIEAVFETKGGSYLEKVELFDVYEGSQIGDGFKSLAYNLLFRAKDKTLEEGDISPALDKILKALESMGIELRK